jgi:hypothetical protein
MDSSSLAWPFLHRVMRYRPHAVGRTASGLVAIGRTGTPMAAAPVSRQVVKLS